MGLLRVLPLPPAVWQGSGIMKPLQALLAVFAWPNMASATGAQGRNANSLFFWAPIGHQPEAVGSPDSRNPLTASGANGRIRTDDLIITNDLLYP